MNRRGFTLLEMLVALSILSLAALALIRLDAFAVRTAAAIDGGSLARIVAANAATDILTAPSAPAPGQQSVQVSNGGRNWTVTTNAVPSEDPALLRITIVVAGNDDRATLIIVRASGGGSA
jgi:general secretion pathway protein I